MSVHLFIPALPESELKILIEEQRKMPQENEEQFDAIQELGSDCVLNRYLAINIAERNIRDLHVHRVGLSEEEIVNNCSQVNLERDDKVIFAGIPDAADEAASCSTSLFQAANSEQLRNKFRDHAVYLAQPRAFCSNNYGDIVTEDIDKIHPFPFKKVTQEKFRNVYRAFINKLHDSVPEAANSVFSMGNFERPEVKLLELIQKLIQSE